jgi:hypothetical protein
MRASLFWVCGTALATQCTRSGGPAQSRSTDFGATAASSSTLSSPTPMALLPRSGPWPPSRRLPPLQRRPGHCAVVQRCRASGRDHGRCAADPGHARLYPPGRAAQRPVHHRFGRRSRSRRPHLAASRCYCEETHGGTYAQGNHWAAASARARCATNWRRTSSMASRSGNTSRVTSWRS